MAFCQECKTVRVVRRNLFCDACKVKIYKAEKLWKQHINGKTLTEIGKEQGLSASLVSNLLSKYLKERKKVA